MLWPSGPPPDPPPAPLAQRPVSLGTVHWPQAGVSAAHITGLGVVAGPGARRPVPIASVAKVMTAYVVLRDHPLSRGQQGPAIVVQAAEAAAYPAEVRSGESLVPVTAGERISERQALEALLLPSADNMAWILARWDAGSQVRFAARMNAAARQLGMTATRYTDPSGLAASTVSSAADQVLLGRAAMRQPALAAIVAMRSAVIPVAGPVSNLNTLLGQGGIAGLKTGSDSAAGGCVLLAAWRDVRTGGSRILIVAAVLGQPGTPDTILPNALGAGRHLMHNLNRALQPRGGHGAGQRARRVAEPSPSSSSQ
jgi:serine-type D-Ala-D-Ala carboxypeptidase (penicillin-binding protein 5/6)